MKNWSLISLLCKSTMITVLLGAFFATSCVCFVGEQGDKIILAESKQSKYIIVQAEKSSDTEKFAAVELSDFLTRVTGASFRIASESSLADKSAPCIYVGWTAYAAQNGIDASLLGEEEWVIRTIGNNLILTGGRPRGTLYAVYEFLERQVGCHWLDRDTEIVPSRPQLSISKLDVKGKPLFWRRELASLAGTDKEQAICE